MSQTTTPRLAEKLRMAAGAVRTKSYPLSDLIPLLQQAADALDAMRASPELRADLKALAAEAEKFAAEMDGTLIALSGDEIDEIYERERPYNAFVYQARDLMVALAAKNGMTLEGLHG